jgi:hypothetical protein
MKAETAVAIINTAMWLGVSAAVIIAVIYTGRIGVFWFYLIPAMSGYATKQSKSEKGD